MDYLPYLRILKSLVLKNIEFECREHFDHTNMYTVWIFVFLKFLFLLKRFKKYYSVCADFVFGDFSLTCKMLYIV